MAKTSMVFRCATCGATTPRWVGRCPGCGEWDGMTEVDRRRGGGAERARRAPLSLVPPAIPGAERVPEASIVPSGVGELDRVLSGGFAPGSPPRRVTEPGIGKSTLVLQALAGLARTRT